MFIHNIVITDHFNLSPGLISIEMVSRTVRLNVSRKKFPTNWGWSSAAVPRNREL